MPVYKLSLTAASTTVANSAASWAILPVSDTTGPNGTTQCGDQIADVSAVSAANGAVGTIAFAWVNGDYAASTPNDGVTKYVTASVTATTRRQNYGQPANGYVCTVAFADSTSKVDLIGTGQVIDLSSSGAPRNKRFIYVGCTDLGGLTSIDLYITTTRVL